MKKILIILLVTNFVFGTSQTNNLSTNSEPLKQVAIPKKKYSSATTSAFLDTLKHSICLEKQFSIVFYIVLDPTLPTSPNYPVLTSTTPQILADLITELNNTFKPICVSFANCSTVLIPNYNYGRSWKKNPTESYVTANYYTDKTINIYLADTVQMVGSELIGYTYEPSTINLNTPKKDLLVIDKQFILSEYSANVKHLLGHYFGLPHTFDEIAPTPIASPTPPPGVISQEFVDGSNCYTHGDGFCDTEADPIQPYLFPKDGMGNFYTPPRDNLMSFYKDERCRFTQEQYNRMAYVIMTKRLYLH